MMLSISDSMLTGYSGMTSLAISGVPPTITPDELCVCSRHLEFDKYFDDESKTDYGSWKSMFRSRYGGEWIDCYC